MDLSIVIATVFDFVKLLLVFAIVSFIAYKLFSPVREKIAQKYSLSWAKSVLLLNFVIIFLIIILTYLFFMYVGISAAPLRDPDLDFNFVETIVLFLSAVPRLFVAGVILALLLFFFELLASFFMTKKEIKKGKEKNSWLKQFVGICVSCAVCLVLVLFVFDWLPLGLVLFIFYGTVKALPLGLLL